MYCANCGMRLPEWARFCERCGAPVRSALSPDDPIDHVEADDTSVEPLWLDDASADEPSNLVEESPADKTQLKLDDSYLETQMLDLVQFVEALEADRSASAQGEPVPDAPQAPLGSDDSPGSTMAALMPADGQVQEAADGSPSLSASTSSKAHQASALQDQAREDNRGRIDVGEDDGWDQENVSPGGFVTRHWDDHREDTGPGPALSLKTVALLAALAIGIGFVVAYLVLGGSGEIAPTDAPVMERIAVSKEEAASVVAGLDGWWKTDRTFDGRSWHIQGGVMETYAADGKLAAQVLVDPASVERLSSGPGGIEGPGYYLRDIAFYLRDGEPDTLYAIDGDGSALDDANLFRTEAPASVAQTPATTEQEAAEPQEGVVAQSDDYLLPESSTRAYTAEELEQLSDHDLFVARNEIYAKHGYVFDAGELSDYFGSKTWYQPSEVFNEGEITDIERQNVTAILAIEQARGSQYV